MTKNNSGKCTFYSFTRIMAAIIIFTLAGTFFSCKKEGNYGTLGIVVPAGEEKVTEKSPYVISGVYSGSPADKAGLKPDDIIIRVNDVQIQGLAYDYVLKRLLRGKVNSEVTLTVNRNGESKEITVVRGR